MEKIQNSDEVNKINCDTSTNVHDTVPQPQLNHPEIRTPSVAIGAQVKPATASVLVPPTPTRPDKTDLSEQMTVPSHPHSGQSAFGSPGEDDGGSTAPPEEESGLEWVTERTGVEDFTQIARSLISDVSQSLKLAKSIPSSREPEPEEVVAWAYVKAYFEEDCDSTYGILHQPTFENLLRAHFKGSGSSNAEPDPAWYAVRHVVYAAGCRIVDTRASAQAARYSLASSRSWKYFENALSVHTDLLYCHTSLMAVQALVMMAIFVEAIGCPSIDYMLCSSAMRLAISKGLHRQPPAAWNLSKVAVQTRSFLWWSIYCYDRLNASRAGRPLAIDDNDVTCQVPAEVPPSCRMNLANIRAANEHAKISGQINQRIATLKLRRSSLQDLNDTITDLSRQLNGWWDGLPSFIKDDLRSPSRILPPAVHFEQVVYHHYSYYSSIVAIHSILVHPWSTAAFQIAPHQTDEFARLKAASMEVYVNATRNFIHNLPHLAINALSPKW
ncbi:uncharacterized protein A1O9_12856 [Exophiala aquamarina CBS 119918]|uniref:Xylanolytic transcriptional activator regulatory domain-containing protein n=1 Tax=Exophiala aquamarina CBS 119918 TaxID=1182545 RepID=A0A072NT66_9EURO|nr:uncharacterized protein A1O9_12856 [Exophiala aquamarina CBS 119918]KEF51074.1 hypothetical protein A1O9_12856 [Exophiala aquamarina CBS 119918]